MESQSHSSDSEPMETKPTVTNTSKGRPFTQETVAVLEALYAKGMTGWGKKHVKNIGTAICSTGLHLDQVKVCLSHDKNDSRYRFDSIKTELD